MVYPGELHLRNPREIVASGRSRCNGLSPVPADDV